MLESALYADDLDAAEAFYTSVLGLEVATRVPGRHVFFRLGRAMLLIFNADAAARGPSEGTPYPVPAHGARGPGHLCFSARSDEIDLWETRLRDAGVEIEADFRWKSGARSLYFRDPAGNSLEFAEPRLWF